MQQYLKKVSFSRLKTYSHCPKQFDYKYVQEAPELPTNLNTLFGSSLHHAAQQFVHYCLEKKQFPPLSFITEQFSSDWQKSISDLELKYGKQHLEQLIKVSQNTILIQRATKWKNRNSFDLHHWNALGSEILERFYKSERDSLCFSGSQTHIFDTEFSEFDDPLWMQQYLQRNKSFVQNAMYRTPLFTEKEFEFQLLEGCDIVLRGAIDRIDKEWIYNETTDEYKENLILIEYKTDVMQHSFKKYVEQIHTYAYALKKELNLSISKAVLSGLRTGQEIVIPIEEEKVKEMEKWLQETVTEISETKEFIATPSALNCKFCPFKQICPSSAAHLGR